MIRRIWKDLREIQLYWIGLLLLAFAASHYFFNVSIEDYRGTLSRAPNPAPFDNITMDVFLYPLDGRMNSCFALEYVFLVLLAVALWGGEFSHGAAGRLLAQPIERRRLYLEKLAALAAVYGSLLLVHCAIYFKMAHFVSHEMDRQLALPGAPITMSYPYHLTASASVHRAILTQAFIQTAFATCAFGNGICASLFLRRTHTAFWAAMAFPIAIALILVTLASWIESATGLAISKLPAALLPDAPDGYLGNRSGFPFFLTLAIWAAIATWIGWHKFKRLEV